MSHFAIQQRLAQHCKSTIFSKQLQEYYNEHLRICHSYIYLFLIKILLFLLSFFSLFLSINVCECECVYVCPNKHLSWNGSA